MPQFLDEPAEIIQSRKLIGFGQTEEALKQLTNSIENHLSDVNSAYLSLLLSEKALLVLSEFDEEIGISLRTLI